ncbi:MAG: nodulation protein NfeD [Chloroflexota bacterium]|nr:nodulation protein NfeD [Chloroflexota bacterium]
MNRNRRFFSIILFVILLSMFFLPDVQAQDGVPLVMVLSVDGAVTPAMVEYLERGIRIAEQRGAEVLIFQLNTPGGGVEAMGDIVQIIRASEVPVVVYVAPRGAIAGSAGTVITLAGHKAAMAPETAIGAASPVGSQGEDIGETMEAKVKQILKAQVRSLAEQRGPEAVALAESTIESAKAVSSQEALDAGLVDFIATDVHDLLGMLDGCTVETSGGERRLHTTNVEISRIDLSLIEQFLMVLTNPNIVFILLTLGVQAILIELSHPGGWVAGFVGVVCLSLAAYGLGVLPVNWFGLIFLATAFVLFILDIKAPTHGALTVAGVTALIVGALVLFNSPSTPQFQRVSVPLVVVSSFITGGMFVVALVFALRAQKTPVRTGREAMIGLVGIAQEEIPPFGAGAVRVKGERWSAESAQETAILSGSRVEVLDLNGIRLRVQEINKESNS